MNKKFGLVVKCPWISYAIRKDMRLGRREWTQYGHVEKKKEDNLCRAGTSPDIA